MFTPPPFHFPRENGGNVPASAALGARVGERGGCCGPSKDPGSLLCSDRDHLCFKPSEKETAAPVLVRPRVQNEALERLHAVDGATVGGLRFNQRCCQRSPPPLGAGGGKALDLRRIPYLEKAGRVFEVDFYCHGMFSREWCGTHPVGRQRRQDQR